MKIHGVIQSHDEWGIVAVAVTHALLNHVDTVLVLDHGSSDETSEGMRHLSTLFPNRISVINLAGDRFHQAAVANLLVHLIKADPGDWIYPFDADEFLLTRDGAPLSHLLRAPPDHEVCVRYDVMNYASVRDFDTNRLADYRGLRFACPPSDDLDPGIVGNGEACARMIEANQLSFFDIPFPSKVIFRNRPGVRVNAGAHGITVHGVAPPNVPPDPGLFAAHLVFATRDRLNRKAEHGARHEALNRPAWLGWHVRMLNRLAREGRLDEFWERHSLPDGGSFRVREEPVFADSLVRTLDFLADGFESPDLSRIGNRPIPRRQGAETPIPPIEIIAFADSVTRQLEEAFLRAQNEMEAVRAALNQARWEQALAVAQRDALLSSRLWRMTQPLRTFIDGFRQVLPSRGRA